MLETALVLPVLLLVVLGTIEVGLSIHRRNTAAFLARETARQAAVHGSLAAPKMSVWGPKPVTWSVELRKKGDSPAVLELDEMLQPYLGYMDHPNASVQVRWPDEANHFGNTVEVTVVIPGEGSFVLSKLNYSATCRMEIAH
jgi:Flp pilus assembly protein TadG